MKHMRLFEEFEEKTISYEIKRVGQDPPDRKGLMLHVTFSFDDNQSKKMRISGYQTKPTFNAWDLLKKWDSTQGWLKDHGMSDEMVEQLKSDLENA